MLKDADAAMVLLMIATACWQTAADWGDATGKKQAGAENWVKWYWPTNLAVRLPALKKMELQAPAK
jgi:hypothetical protein